MKDLVIASLFSKKTYKMGFCLLTSVLFLWLMFNLGSMVGNFNQVTDPDMFWKNMRRVAKKAAQGVHNRRCADAVGQGPNVDAPTDNVEGEEDVTDFDDDFWDQIEDRSHWTLTGLAENSTHGSTAASQGREEKGGGGEQSWLDNGSTSEDEIHLGGAD